jgi:hypothetical protein
MNKNPHRESYLTTLATGHIRHEKNDMIMRMLTIVKVSISSLGPEDEESSNGNIGKYSKGAKPPNDRVSNEVDVTMILYPEILDAFQPPGPKPKAEDTDYSTKKTRP